MMPALLAAAAATGASLPPREQADIEALLERVGASGCDFQRNGTWYAAAAAGDHLRRKYRVLREAGRICDAEDFIVLVGTKSSFSGEAYAVRCARTAVESGAHWLRAQLSRQRAAPLQPAPRSALPGLEECGRDRERPDCALRDRAGVAFSRRPSRGSCSTPT